MDGGDSLQIWRVVASIFNKQVWTPKKGWSLDWGLGEGLIIPHCKEPVCYEMLQGLRFGHSLEMVHKKSYL